MRTKAGIAGVLLVTAGSAWAQEPTTVVANSPYTERVVYQPAALASESGIRDLRRRVRSAAHRVCDLGYDSGIADYREWACYVPTLADAMEQVDRAVARWARREAPDAHRIVVAAR